MKKTALTCALLAGLLCLPTGGHAQEMPAPRRMPREPVSRQTLDEQRHEPAAGRTVQGPAAILDGEKLRIGDTDLRLFGIVPPQLAASFGPQARAALDSIAAGQSVSCAIRDRDRDGRLLATCHAANGDDMALDLLRRGLAVSARGSITGTELATPYLSAEQAAQNQHLGLWSVATPAPATLSASAATPPVAATATPPAPPAPASEKTAPPPAEAQARIAADNAASREAQRADESDSQSNETIGFFERYQILIAGCLMFATALSIITALWAQKRRDRRDETRAVAAALRGELMAARGVCIGRIKSIASEEDDRAAIWPRIRTTLYQAYVGRLGLLGAELARQIASIYGQSSDYAALYSPTGAAPDGSKKQALETLTRHIDEILPKLAGIEQKGFLALPTYGQRPRSRYDAAPRQPTLAAPTTAYKTITAPVKKIAAAQQPPVAPTPSPAALWEAVRGFIQNHRNAIAESEATPPDDEHVSQYAAMIEADMARYATLEPLDITPNKKRM